MMPSRNVFSREMVNTFFDISLFSCSISILIHLDTNITCDKLYVTEGGIPAFQ